MKSSTEQFHDLLVEFQDRCLSGVPRVARGRAKCPDKMLTEFAEKLAIASQAAALEVLRREIYVAGRKREGA